MESTEADAAGRLFTAASTGNLEVVKNLVTANGALIRAADQQGLYPGFTGRASFYPCRAAGCANDGSTTRMADGRGALAGWQRVGGADVLHVCADAIAADRRRPCSCSTALVRAWATAGRQRKEAAIDPRGRCEAPYWCARSCLHAVASRLRSRAGLPRRVCLSLPYARARWANAACSRSV